MAQRHVIYGLYDPTDDRREIRYVGYTHFTPGQRIIDHISGARRHNKTHKQKWIRKLFRNGVEPDFVVLEITTAKDWKFRETFWIADLRAGGHRLTNATDGGEGLVNPSKGVRERISAKVSAGLMGNSRRSGRPHSSETRQAISESLKSSRKFKRSMRKWRGIARHIPNEAERQIISEKNSGRKRPDSIAIARMMSKQNIGAFWANNGLENVLVRPGKRCPSGFVRGRLLLGRPHSEESKRKISRARLGKPGPEISKKGRRSISEHKKNSRWITDGSILRQIPVGVEPPEGWRFGRKLVEPEATT